MFKYLLSVLPVKAILTFIPELFMPQLNELASKGVKSDSAKLLLCKIAYISKKITEASNIVYGFCVALHNGNPLNKTKFAEALSWTLESSKDLDNKIQAMGVALDIGWSPLTDTALYNSALVKLNEADEKIRELENELATLKASVTSATLSDHTSDALNDHTSATLSDHTSATLSDHTSATLSDHTSDALSDQPTKESV